jgi:hypothetical protein
LAIDIQRNEVEKIIKDHLAVVLPKTGPLIPNKSKAVDKTANEAGNLTANSFIPKI